MDKNTVITIVYTLASALLGGWIGATLQSRLQRKLHIADLLWDVRMKLHEAEQEMWEAKDYIYFEAPINWLRVAASDPRVSIDQEKIERYAKLLEKGYRDRTSSEELTDDEAGIDVIIAENIETIRKEIDALVLERLKQLKLR